MILSKFYSAHQNRIFGLDLLRAIAILLVVMGHTRWMLTSFPKPVASLLQGSGILGVELFFVLSGFLIGRILLLEFEKNKYTFSWADIKYFWMRRWLRTLPNYIFILLVFIICYKNHLPNNLGSYFIFMQNFAWQAIGFFDESWTLAIEEHTYLLAPIVLFILSAYLFKQKRKEVFLISTIFVIVAITLIRSYYSIRYADVISDWDEIRRVVIYRLDTIFYGFLGAYIAQYYPQKWFRYKYLLAILGFIICLPILIYYKKEIKDQVPGVLDNISLVSLLSISILFMLPLFASIKDMKQKTIAIPITFVSVVSYSLYLLNDKLLSVAFKNYFQDMNLSFAPSLLLYLSYWFVVLILSYACYLWVEKPAMVLRNHPFFAKKEIK